jgi:hypothetical protein
MNRQRQSIGVIGEGKSSAILSKRNPDSHETMIWRDSPVPRRSWHAKERGLHSARVIRSIAPKDTSAASDKGLIVGKVAAKAFQLSAAMIIDALLKHLRKKFA